jgi:hypothetical protein
MFSALSQQKQTSYTGPKMRKMTVMLGDGGLKALARQASTNSSRPVSSSSAIISKIK